MNITLEGIIIIVGNYGSGKTEVVINLAAHRKRAGADVRVADLDLINPYFRTREARQSLEEIGIEVVIPAKKYFYADLPILCPDVAGLIRKPSQLTLLDAGGNDAGVAVLAALADSLKVSQSRTIQVVNPYRPFTDTIQGCLKIRDEIEKVSKLSVTGVIGNANLLDETTADHILEGYEFIQALCQETDLLLAFITTPVDLIHQLDMNTISCPVLPIHRQLVPPWKSADKLI